MRILYVTTIGGTMVFFKKFIKQLIDEGHSVDIATNETASKVPECYSKWGCKTHAISCTRTPINKGTLLAIKEIYRVVKENNYDIVHCHTPIAAMCTRVACVPLRKRGVKVLYTAHGFHFYKGAPIKNWLIYFPIEKVCSYFTDGLVTINQEDYQFAKKHMNAQKIEYVPGVGIDIKKFENISVDRSSMRQSLGVPDNAKLLISVGELNQNKNHETIIRALGESDDKNLYYVIAGKGEKETILQNLIEELNLSDRVKLLGFRSDIGELYKSADLLVFPSYREGLSVALMEAMAVGLPCIVSKIRGNIDLIDDGKGGYWFNPYDYKRFLNVLNCLDDENLRKFGRYNKQKIETFSSENVIAMMKDIYISLN